MASSGAPPRVMFEEVAVYFTQGEWAELAKWQKDLYCAVMVENYEAVTSFAHSPPHAGRPSVKPKLIWKIERDQDPSTTMETQKAPLRKRAQSPWLGHGIRIEEGGEEGREGHIKLRRPSRAPHGRKRKGEPRMGQVEELKKKKIRLPGAQRSKEVGRPPRVALKRNPPICPECGKTFLSNVAMTIHIRTHTGERPFKCHLCPKGFPSMGDLKRHLRTHLCRKELVGGAEAQEEPPRARKCLVAKLQLLRHLGGGSLGPRKPHTCTLCGKSFNKCQDLRKHEGTHSTERPFPCLECGRSFRLKQILVAHLKVHMGERPYACERCGKRFSQKHHVESHQRVHTGEKPFACSTCGKRYAQKQPLISHLRIHTGERPYTCAECGKTFRNQATLTIHNRVHTGERPYRCLLCDKTCSQLQHLKSHQRVHRDEQHLLAAGNTQALALKRARDLQEKPFPCARCGKRFRDKRIMQAHLKTHKRAVADKHIAFPGRGILTRQSVPALALRPEKEPRMAQSERSTHGMRDRPSKRGRPTKRPVTCSDCGKKFTQARYLAMHWKSHT